MTRKPTRKRKAKVKIDREAESFQLRLMTLDPGRLYCLDGILKLFEASGIIDASTWQEEATSLEPRGARYLGDKGQLFGWQWQGYDNWHQAIKCRNNLVSASLPDDTIKRWFLPELVSQLSLPDREASTYFLLFQTQAFLIGRDPDQCHTEDGWVSSNKKKRSLYLLPADTCWPGPICADTWQHVFFAKPLPTLPDGILKPEALYTISDVQQQCFPESLTTGQEILEAEEELHSEWWRNPGNQERKRLEIYGLSRLLGLPPEGETRSLGGTPRWSGRAWMNGSRPESNSAKREGNL